jgi:hypothetical protein
MAEKHNHTRRSVLKKAGVSVGVLLSGTGLSSASNGNRPSEQRSAGSGGVVVENGKFVLDATPDEIGQTTYKLTKIAVRDFNAAIEAGYFSVDSSSTGVQPTSQGVEQSSLTVSEEASTDELAEIDSVEYPTASLKQVEESEAPSSLSLTTQGCNRDAVTSKEKLLPPKVYVNIFLSNQTIGTLSILGGAGGPGGKLIFNVLKNKGVTGIAALSGPVGAVAAASAAAYWGVILYQNKGCGVQIKTGLSPVNPTVVVPTVSPQ